MEKLSTLFATLYLIPAQTLLGILIIFMMIGFTWLHHAQALHRNLPKFRPLPALDTLRAALRRGAETGRAIHLSPGTGSIGQAPTMAQTMAGVLAAARVIEETALKGTPVLVTSGDAVTHLALKGALRQAYQYAGQAQDYDPASVRLLALEDPTAYATGLMTTYSPQRLEASQIIGHLGPEFILAGEEAAQYSIPQLVGTTSVSALPLLFLVSPSVLIGEEVFAAEAYLTASSTPQARLLTQDALRITLLLLVVGGLLLQSLAALQPMLPFSLPLP